MEKKYMLIISEGVTYDFEDNHDAVKCIIEEYQRHDVCIGELLSNICLVGVSVQDVVDIFATVMKKIENDTVIHIVEGCHNERGLDT